jgi:hypothetical protein
MNTRARTHTHPLSHTRARAHTGPNSQGSDVATLDLTHNNIGTVILPNMARKRRSVCVWVCVCEREREREREERERKRERETAVMALRYT